MIFSNPKELPDDGTTPFSKEKLQKLKHSLPGQKQKERRLESRNRYFEVRSGKSDLQMVCLIFEMGGPSET